MKSLAIIIAIWMVSAPLMAEGPPSFLGGLAKPQVTHEEVSQKVRAVIDGLGGVEIKAKDAELIFSIQKTLTWVEAKVKQDLKAQASDLINARDVCESKLKGTAPADAK